jgi:hypothetical protein
MFAAKNYKKRSAARSPSAAITVGTAPAGAGWW